MGGAGVQDRARAGKRLDRLSQVAPRQMAGGDAPAFRFPSGGSVSGRSSAGAGFAERDGVVPPRFAKVIVNLELVRAEEYVTRLIQTEVAWDLVIFDEAHHLRNTDTRSHALARLMCERSKAAVFLTATPLQTGLEDIVHLMEALGVDAAADPHLLEEQMRWDMGLNDWMRIAKGRPPGWRKLLDGALCRLEATGGRVRPGWGAFKALAARSSLDDTGQRTVVLDAARDLQALSPYMTRTLRSDVDEDRPTREAITRTVQFSPKRGRFKRGNLPRMPGPGRGRRGRLPDS